MKSFGNTIAAATALLSSFAAAQDRACFATDFCASMAVPDEVASKGTGNLYVQIKAPTSYQWAAIGTGSRMSGSTMFFIHADGKGNVTISPRKGTGNVMPQYDQSISYQRLAGSGVDGDTMTANILVPSLDIDLGSDDSPFIGAWKTGSPINSASVDEIYSKHSDYNRASYDLTEASVAEDVNPYVGSDGATATPDPNEDEDEPVVANKPSKKTLYIHALVASLAFVVVMPFASVLMPLLGKWYVHAGIQLCAVVMTWVGLGLGYKLAKNKDILFKQTHTILGTCVIVAVLIQPVFGWLHHKHYLKYKGRGTISHVHIWYGRLLMIVGVLNGGIGLKLHGAERSYKIAYAATALVMACVYIGGKVAATKRKALQYKRTSLDEIDLPDRADHRMIQQPQGPVPEWHHGGRQEPVQPYGGQERYS